MKYKCLSIAGFDGSGGAGIQADLKAFSATGSYGMTVLTALPVQNTCGVRSCYDITIQCIQEQMEAIFDDIVPDAIKIGMLYSTEIIELISDFIALNARGIPIILDPVMVAKSGDSLLKPDAVSTMKSKLIPLTSIITPNIPEAEALVGARGKREMAYELLNIGCKSVLLKGGHEGGETSVDLFVSRDREEVISSMRVESRNTHGTGCTLSAAVASYMAQGMSAFDACQSAKAYLLEAIIQSKDISVGKGHGPVHHFHQYWK